MGLTLCTIQFHSASRLTYQLSSLQRCRQILYADGIDEVANSEAMDQVSQSCDNYHLTICTKRPTRAVHQPAFGQPYNEPTITVTGQILIDTFTNMYLGRTLSSAEWIDDDITARAAKASEAFGRPCKYLGAK